MPGVEAIKAFENDWELTVERVESGSVIESGVTPSLADDYLTKYPEAHLTN